MPWNNGLIEWHNAILGYAVVKTMEDCKTGLSTGSSWAVSAKNYLNNVSSFNPNQLVFGSNLNLPNNVDSKLPAHEGKTSSEIVAEN